jgi:hypothetical protein
MVAGARFKLTFYQLLQPMVVIAGAIEVSQQPERFGAE